MSTDIPPTNDLPPSFPIPLRRFSVEEYHRMIDAGVFGEEERFELLEGLIVSKMPGRPPRDMAIETCTASLLGCLPRAWRNRTQSAIRMADSEPEPDVVLVAGAIRDYEDRHPGPGDLALVIEVADSSLISDRLQKGRVYA